MSEPATPNALLQGPSESDWEGRLHDLIYRPGNASQIMRAAAFYNQQRPRPKQEVIPEDASRTVTGKRKRGAFILPSDIESFPERIQPVNVDPPPSRKTSLGRLRKASKSNEISVLTSTSSETTADHEDPFLPPISTTGPLDSGVVTGWRRETCGRGEVSRKLSLPKLVRFSLGDEKEEGYIIQEQENRPPRLPAIQVIPPTPPEENQVPNTHEELVREGLPSTAEKYINSDRDEIMEFANIAHRKSSSQIKPELPATNIRHPSWIALRGWAKLRWFYNSGLFWANLRRKKVRLAYNNTYNEIVDSYPSLVHFSF